MADAHALGACGETRGGSSPLPPIIRIILAKEDLIEPCL